MDILDVKKADRQELDTLLEKIASYNSLDADEALSCVILNHDSLIFQTKKASDLYGYHGGIVTTDPVPVGVSTTEHDIEPKDKFKVFIVDTNNPSFDATKEAGEVELYDDETEIRKFVTSELFDVESTAKIEIVHELNAIYVLIENTPACVLERFPEIV